MCLGSTHDTDDSGMKRVFGKRYFQYAAISLNTVDRGVVLYLSLDHCNLAEWSKIYFEMVKTRMEKEGASVKPQKFLKQM